MTFVTWCCWKGLSLCFFSVTLSLCFSIGLWKSFNFFNCLIISSWVIDSSVWLDFAQVALPFLPSGGIALRIETALYVVNFFLQASSSSGALGVRSTKCIEFTGPCLTGSGNGCPPPGGPGCRRFGGGGIPPGGGGIPPGGGGTPPPRPPGGPKCLGWGGSGGGGMPPPLPAMVKYIEKLCLSCYKLELD